MDDAKPEIQVLILIIISTIVAIATYLMLINKIAG